ncbi:MAG: nickel-dependent lactate racemase [Deltaproteobacteria bacterium]|nr:nickel-dependent lactate racemase [Deltaproteobacteria bacterium]
MFSIPYGKTQIEFELPDDMHGVVAEPRPVKPLASVRDSIEEALNHPVNSPPIEELAKPGHRICIVFTDITRHSPDRLFIPALLRRLESAGVRDRDIVLLCGIGMHRASTTEEKITKLGKEVVDRFRVVDNEPQNPAALMDLGESEEGIPLSVNRIAYETDLLIATGIVEPHQYAGYSGGRKTLAIGAAGEAMIEYTHGPGMVDHPGTRLGMTEGNPFHQAITLAARRAGLRFIINAVQDGSGRPVSVMAGEPEATFEALVGVAREFYEVPVPRQYDVAVAGVGSPKDDNLYQASRAASYLFFAPTPVVREGGVIIIPAPTPEGVGHGVGERRFLEKMKQAQDLPSFLDRMRREGYPPGAQRAYVMAKVLEKNTVVIVGSQTPDVVRRLQMVPARDMQEAFSMAARMMGRKDLEVLIIPNALLTLPIVQEDQGR